MEGDSCTLPFFGKDGDLFPQEYILFWFYFILVLINAENVFLLEIQCEEILKPLLRTSSGISYCRLQSMSGIRAPFGN